MQPEFAGELQDSRFWLLVAVSLEGFCINV